MSILNRKRMHSRSNQALTKLIQAQPQYSYPHPSLSLSPSPCPSTHTSIQHILTTQLQLQQRSLFKQSYCKIQHLKSMLIYKTASKSILSQLNDIIDLIKGERVKAKFAILQLAQQAYQAQAEKNTNVKESQSTRGEKGSNRTDAAVNTDDIVIDQYSDAIDIAVQVDISNKVQQKQRNSEKKYQTYYKLACMIDKLKVDYRQILPNIQNFPQKYILPDVQSNKGNYKVLKPAQILKLQKVFMTKLRGMITVQQQQKSTITEPIATSIPIPTPPPLSQIPSSISTAITSQSPIKVVPLPTLSPVTMAISTQILSLAMNLVKQSKQSATPVKIIKEQKMINQDNSTGVTKIKSSSISLSKSKSNSNSNSNSKSDRKFSLQQTVHKQKQKQKQKQKERKFENMMKFV